MIKIAQDRDVVTLINSFSCEPQNQQHLIDAWIRPPRKDWGCFLESFPPPCTAARMELAL